MVTRDAAFGHRDPLTGAPMGDIDEWIDWDFHLAGAHSIIEAYTDEHGIYTWLKNSRDVVITAESRTDEFQAAIQGIQNQKNRVAPLGEYFVPNVMSNRDDKTLPTYAEWRKEVSMGLFEPKEVGGPRLDKMKPVETDPVD